MELNTKNMLIGCVAAVLITVAIMVGWTIMWNQSSADSADVAISCTESGGTWINTSADCIMP